MSRKLFAIASCLLLLAGCKKDGGEEQSVKFSVTPTTVSFSSNDTATRQVTVTAENTEWDFTAPDSWVTVTRNGNVLTVSVAENTAETARESKITVTPSASGVNAVEVTVKQQGFDKSGEAPSIEVNPSSLQFAATDAAAQTVTVTTKGGAVWAVRSNANWVKAEKSGDNTISISVVDADTSVARQATVAVYNDNQEQDPIVVNINVYQKGLDLPAAVRVEGIPDGIPQDGSTPHIEYRHFDDGRIVAVDKEGNIVNNVILTVFIEPREAYWTAEAEGPYSVYAGGENGGQNGVALQAGWSRSDERPVSTEELNATITIRHSDPNVEPFVFTAHKSAMEKTDLGGTGDDVNNDFQHAFLVSKSFVKNYSKEDEKFDFMEHILVLYDDGIVFGETNLNNQPQQGSNGRALRIHFIDNPKRDAQYPDNAVQVDINEYTVTGTFTTDLNQFIGQAETGDYIYNNTSGFTPMGTLYCKYVDGNVMSGSGLVEGAEMARIVSGKLTISTEGNQADITWDFIDENGSSIKGSYKGDLKSGHNFVKNIFGGGGIIDDDWGVMEA